MYTSPELPGRISRRIAAIAESATLAIDAKAKALKATGRDVVGFGAGEPDFPTPEPIVAAAIEACRDPRWHHYTPTAGIPELRAAIAAKTERDSGYRVDASQVVVTNGGKQALYNTCAVLLDPGDEVLLPSPYWVTYPEVVGLAGGVVVVVPTSESTGFRATLDQLEAARTERTKAMIFVSPSNPTGAVYPRAEVEAIGRWAAEHGIWVISDEIYEHLVYGDASFHSMPALVPELAERCVVVNGVAKTYAMTGWRVGWMIAPPDVTAAATNLQSHSTSNVANVSQVAAPGVSCVEPQGAFYCFPSFAGVVGREIRGRRAGTTLELAGLVLDEVGVAIVPGEAFGAAGYARLSYALGDDDLVEGVTRMGKLLAEAE
ncbi:MAG: pyridoxal phosphate-dependent aminotransferase [Actinobacteria bacterium]|nr:MAG: pyridoxal phosphate-dependent aminotransferase [Actinomycetota bacterium]